MVTTEWQHDPLANGESPLNGQHARRTGSSALHRKSKGNQKLEVNFMFAIFGNKIWLKEARERVATNALAIRGYLNQCEEATRRARTWVKVCDLFGYADNLFECKLCNSIMTPIDFLRSVKRRLPRPGEPAELTCKCLTLLRHSGHSGDYSNAIQPRNEHSASKRPDHQNGTKAFHLINSGH